MEKIKKDRFGRIFEVGMVVLNLYPATFRTSGKLNGNRQVVVAIEHHKTNTSKLLITLDEGHNTPSRYDAEYLLPLKYVTESLELLYGKE
jgi:hypothetical protein